MTIITLPLDYYIVANNNSHALLRKLSATIPTLNTIRFHWRLPLKHPFAPIGLEDIDSFHKPPFPIATHVEYPYL